MARTAAAAGVLGVLLVASTAGEARGSPGWSWPVEGRVVTHYSNEAANPYAGGVHRGIDIAAATGTPVHAARAGEVIYAGALGYAGLTVSVRTADGYLTSYLHLAGVAVRRGEAVGAGADLGEVGTTGRRSKAEPHLHFGVRVAGEERHYVDPLALLPPLPGATPAASPPPVPAMVPVAPRPEPVRATPRPVRPMPRPVPVLAGARPRVRAAPAPARLPALAPVQRPAPAAGRPHRHRHPLPLARRSAPAPAPAPRAQAASADWGRPLALAGLALLIVALFGGSALRAVARANNALSDRAYDVVVRALRPARAYLPRFK